MSKEVIVPALPVCDICQYGDPFTRERVAPPRNALYDSKTNFSSSWANMCQEHYGMYGVGRLGTGYGQKLVLGTKQAEVKSEECECAYVPGDSGHEFGCPVREKQ
jgi:hypothetical protein